MDNDNINEHNINEQNMPDAADEQETAVSEPVDADGVSKPPRKHRSPVAKTLRVLLWTLLSVIVLVLLLPVLVYIPPVQSWLVDVACDVVHDKTGMQVEIEKFRLKWPLDVSLQGVRVIEAGGDTMVTAGEALADVKMRPLLDLDIQLNKLSLRRGYYRMVSPDSSMVLKIRAEEVVVKPGSNVDLNTSTIDLKEAHLRRADVGLYMNVWKQKPTPEDTTSTPWTIKVGKVTMDELAFGMSMLPTIDTLRLNVKNGELQRGLIDLKTNKITAAYMGMNGGNVTYITPTAQYLKAHPLPPDTLPQKPSEPITIMADSLSLTNFKALYATKGAKPLPGFDAAYMQVDGLNAKIRNFYNRATEIRLPVVALTARERCGLNVTQCSGLLAIDTLGITLDGFKVRTPNSAIFADAFLSYSMMAMQRDGPVSVKAEGSLGFPDILAFMPSLRPMLKPIPQSRPLRFVVDAKGSLASVGISILNIDLPSALQLTARGKVDNLLEPDRLRGDLKFNGYLAQPSLVQQLVPDMGVNIPTMRLVGDAQFDKENYKAHLQMLSPEGDVALDGTLSLGAQGYDADVNVKDLNLGYIMPALGVGHVSVALKAVGQGFDFTNSATYTDVEADVSRLEYGGHSYDRITAGVHLENGTYDIDLLSYDPMADLELNATGNIRDGIYQLDAKADIVNLDLKALGFTPDTNSGSGIIAIQGSVNPEAWLYDVKLDLSNFDWNLPDQYIHLPQALYAKLQATEDRTSLCLRSLDVDADFDSPQSLKSIVDMVPALMDSTSAMIARKRIDVEMLQRTLPQFTFDINASGHGDLQQMLNRAGVQIDTVSLQIANSDKISGRGLLHNLKLGTTAIDTLTLSLNQRKRLLDYRLHMGNRPGTLDDFACVDVGGYFGGNRASMSVTQHDIKGMMGYKLGVTMAAIDDNIEVHFTPLDATIAYMPWTFNDDNFVQYTMSNNSVHALLYATSNESKIEMKSEPNADGDNSLCVKLEKIKIEDFLNLALNAPPLTGTVDADIDLVYKGNAITGEGYIKAHTLTYDRMKVGDVGFNFNADLDFNGNTDATIGLKLNNREVLVGHAKIDNDTVNKKPMQFDLSLTSFPLDFLNPFIGKDVATLRGTLDGKFIMDGSFTKPLLNGYMQCTDAAAKVKMIGTELRLDSLPITVRDNVLDFNKFSIWAVNKNPLRIDGTVDARQLNNILLDMSLKADNMQLVGNDKRAGSDIYGKLFYSLNATAKGSMKYLRINANLNILPATDVYYNVNFAQQTMTQNTNTGVVKFVNFNDTSAVAKADTVGVMLNMKVGASLNIAQGTKVTVNLSSNGTDKVVVNPYGTLNYSQNVMGDMRLTGQLNTGSGSASYNIPAVGNKQFQLLPDSYLLWNGKVMNPTLHINAVNATKANVSTGGQASRTIGFDVSLAVTGTLESPKVMFDLSTDQDMTIQNELQAMSADQRSNQAMNMLIYGSYTGGDSKSTTAFNGENMLYSFLESQINSWAANHIRGVDLSFGIDQRDIVNNGQQGSAMSYSYQVSKSLFNNRFKIVVGGNYSTDSSADENFAQNLISDISFEYSFLQTNSYSLLGKLFRHTGYESILEGQITETGVGIVMKRKLSNFKRLFRFRRKKKTSREDEETDTIPGIRTNRFPTAPVAAPGPDTVPDDVPYY